MTKLDPSEVALVGTTMAVPAALAARLARSGEDGLALDDHETDLLRELATHRLMKHGFDAAYGTTTEGDALERLIDHLNDENLGEDTSDRR